MNSENSSDQKLSDDFNLWPTDPGSLFALGPEASRRDLKRAYSRLIRRFKPEHAPEQFRRLREAFDQLDQQLEWREMLESHRAQSLDNNPISIVEISADDGKDSVRVATQESDAFDRAEPTEPRLQNQRDNHVPSDAHSSVSVSSSHSDQIWQRALDGHEVGSLYLQLHELSKQENSSETDFARLYWLLKIHPDCDTDCDSMSWLIKGINKFGIQNRLLLIFISEIRSRSGGAPLAISHELDLDRLPAVPAIELIHARWFVARRLRRFEMISKDIERLRRNYIDEPQAWQRLLFAATRQSILTKSHASSTLLNDLIQEFERTPSRVDENWIWDQFEEAIALHRAWLVGLQVVPNRINLDSIYLIDLKGQYVQLKNPRVGQTKTLLEQLAALVETTWEGTTSENREVLLLFCDEMIRSQPPAIPQLAAISHVARPLLIRFLELIREQQSESCDNRIFTIAPATETVIHSFVQNELVNNQQWQWAVLSFCNAEAVTPTDLATVIEQNHQTLPESSSRLASFLRFDPVLNCLIEAQRLLQFA